MTVVLVMTAQVQAPDGTPVALIERVTIGGGIRMVEGEPQQHPTFERFHVRLLSPDRMIPDQLREVETYDEACELAEKYAAKREEHAAQVDALAETLKVE